MTEGMMWIFPRPLQELKAADLESLIENRVRESVALEFKRDMYGGRDADIREMLRDISSIANAEGGALVIGMEEDRDGIANQLHPVAEAESQAARLISSCSASIFERIPGLQAVLISIPSGHAIVVRVPRSYRRPHMVTFGGATDFWIRHDRQKARMTIAEIRTAVPTVEDLGMKAETFVVQRRARLGPLTDTLLLTLTATPLLLEEGRIDILAPRLERILHHPPTYRERGGGVGVSSETARLSPTVNGIIASERGLSTLEVFRSGHVEFALRHLDYLIDARPGRNTRVRGWVVAEATRNLVHFVSRMREVFDIVDPYLIALSLWRCRGLEFAERTADPFGTGLIGTFEDDVDLHIAPVLFPSGASPDAITREITNRTWNAFHLARCQFFDEEGRFFIPNR